jgi:hypothetical protein
MEPNEVVQNEMPESEKPETTQQETAEHSGPVDVEAILAKMNIDPQVKTLFDKALIHGMRVMFDQEQFKQTAQYLNQPGDMAKKIADGVVTVVYMLWKKSNETLNPKIIAPLTFALTLKAFEFLQEAKNPEATKEVLGNAVDQSVSTILQKFGVDEATIQKVVAQQKQQAGAQPDQPAGQPGILESANG